jgi:hypothetical protein
MTSMDLLPVIEWVLAAVIGGMSLYFGYRLFIKLPERTEFAEFRTCRGDAEKVMIKMRELSLALEQKKDPLALEQASRNLEQAYRDLEQAYRKLAPLLSENLHLVVISRAVPGFFFFLFGVVVVVLSLWLAPAIVRGQAPRLGVVWDHRVCNAQGNAGVIKLAA